MKNSMVHTNLNEFFASVVEPDDDHINFPLHDRATTANLYDITI